MHTISTVIAASVALIMSLMAATADQSCKAQANDKKLAGAALTSFMTKCETEAKSACDTQAADKKLSGAAKDSFTKKVRQGRRRNVARTLSVSPVRLICSTRSKATACAVWPAPAKEAETEL